jgi:release factor glutamine methyltransferase
MNTHELINCWKEEESIAHIHGWDFAHIEGRYTEPDDLPWDYRAVIQEYLRPEMKILDMCTGSGCIAVSIAKLADIYKHAQMNLCVHAADISEQALAVAQQNIAALEAQVQLIHSDLFSEVTEKYDMIVSNPPYIRTSAIEELEEEVRVHDPFIALDGKEDGLFFYRRIVEESSNYIKDGGYLLFEIGHDQGEDVSCLMKEHGYTDVQIFKDLAGLDRVVAGRLSVGN